jgi:hypothetical protein
MSKVIIFKNESGGVSIAVPTLECLQHYTIEQIAEKDVPEGVPYKIIDRSELPTDRTFRDAWDIDESELTDGVGGSITSFDPIGE